MAWIAKPSPGASLDTGDALYSSVLAYIPLLGTSGGIIDEKNAVTLSGNNPTWTDSGTNPPGYRCAGVTLNALQGFDPSFDPLAGLSAASGVCWLRAGTIASITETALVGIGRWGGGSTTQVISRIQDSGVNWAVGLKCATTNPSVTVAHGMSADTDYTLIWTFASNTLTLYRNTTSLGSDSGASGAISALGGTYPLQAICAASESVEAFGGTGSGIYGCALFDKALDNTERQRMVDEGPAFLYTAAGGLTGAFGEHLSYGSF